MLICQTPLAADEAADYPLSFFRATYPKAGDAGLFSRIIVATGEYGIAHEKHLVLFYVEMLLRALYGVAFVDAAAGDIDGRQAGDVTVEIWQKSAELFKETKADVAPSVPCFFGREGSALA